MFSSGEMAEHLSAFSGPWYRRLEMRMKKSQRVRASSTSGKLKAEVHHGLLRNPEEVWHRRGGHREAAPGAGAPTSSLLGR